MKGVRGNVWNEKSPIWVIESIRGFLSRFGLLLIGKPQFAPSKRRLLFLLCQHSDNGVPNANDWHTKYKIDQRIANRMWTAVDVNKNVDGLGIGVYSA